MKKGILLLLAVFIATIGFGQKGVINKNLTPIMKKDVVLAHQLNKKLPYSVPNFAQKDTFIDIIGEPIGQTNYDLQTNTAVAHRMLLFDNGDISAVWTDYDGSDLPNAPERGTGYNHRSNGSWQFTDMSNTSNVHIEGSQRTGWPALWTDGTNEWVVNHYNSAGGLFLWNQTIGASNTNWTSGQITGTPEAMLWPRAVSVPGHFYVISVDDQTIDATSIQALWFSKSDDGGQTWSTVEMPNFNDYYVHGNGDVYAIDAKDSIVAVVYFGDYGDSKLWKSTDYGDTWTVKTVVDFPIDAFDEDANILDIDNNGEPDTVESTDNTGDVIIDNNGVVHVVFSMMKYLDEATGDGSYSYFPYTDGLYYWNDTMPEAQYNGLDHDNYIALPSNAEEIAYSYDLNGDDTIYQYADAGTGNFPFGTYYTALTSFGTLSVDSSNNVYVTFSTVMEGDNFVATNANPNAQSYRHTWVLARTANGIWSQPHCISTGDGDAAENIFTTVPRRIKDTLYSWTQWDQEPGLNIRGDGDPVTDNYIIFRAVPVKDLLPKTVTFNVDMKAAIDSGIFDPTTDTVFVTGDMFGWAEPGTDIENQMMTDADSDSVYTKVITLNEGDYQYKYFKNSGWNNGEWDGDPNRTFTVSNADVVLNDIWGDKPHIGISELNTANVKFAPNPTDGLLRITADNNYNVTVYDITGRVVTTALMTNNTTSIDLSNVQSGIYLVKLTDGRMSKTFKVVRR